jgi:hypothetical protein
VALIGAQSIDPDDDRCDRIDRHLVADVTAAQEIAQEVALARWKTDPQALTLDVDRDHLVSPTVEGEAPPELVHRDVRTAPNEATEL